MLNHSLIQDELYKLTLPENIRFDYISLVYNSFTLKFLDCTCSFCSIAWVLLDDGLLQIQGASLNEVMFVNNRYVWHASEIRGALLDIIAELIYCETIGQHKLFGDIQLPRNADDKTKAFWGELDQILEGLNE